MSILTKLLMKNNLSLFTLLLLFLAFNTHAGEGNPEACDCKTIVVSEEEARNGCPASVKEQTCPLFRDTMIKKDQLQRQQDLRRRERNMEPRYNPR